MAGVTKEELEKAEKILGIFKQPKEQQTTTASNDNQDQDELVKAEEELKTLTSKIDALKKAKQTQQPVVTTQAFDQKELIKAITDQFAEQFTALGTTIASRNSEIEELKKSNDQLISFNTELGRRLGIVENTAEKRKSLDPTKVKPIEKGGEPSHENSNPNMTVYSLNNTSQRRELAKAMFDIAFDLNGNIKDQEIAKAITDVELGGLGGNAQASHILSAKLKKHNITVVK